MAGDRGPCGGRDSEAGPISGDYRKLHLSGQITEEQARLHLDIQKNASRTVLLTVEGLGLLAAEQAINARVVRDSVNTALDFVLI